MSNKINHRRDGQRRRSEGATLRGWASWGGVQGASRGRRRWKRLRQRIARRTGQYLQGAMHPPIVLPAGEIDE